MGAELIVNEQWGAAIPPIPQAFTQVTDVVANAYGVLKDMPTLMTRWQGMRTGYDSFLQVRLRHALDPYYKIVKESQLAAVLIMNPNASETELFDMCIGVAPASGTSTTVNQLKSLNQDSEQLRAAEGKDTAAGFVPKGV